MSLSRRNLMQALLSIPLAAPFGITWAKGDVNGVNETQRLELLLRNNCGLSLDGSRNLTRELPNGATIKARFTNQTGLTLKIGYDDRNGRTISEEISDRRLSGYAAPRTKRKLFKRALEQLIAYSKNSGISDNLTSSRISPGIVNWKRYLPGLEVTSVDAIADRKVKDRVQLVRIDPEKYRFKVSHDKKGKTISGWQEDLNALVVVNGSYNMEEPAGETLVPIISNGKYQGPQRYYSRHGAFLAEPSRSSSPKVRFVDFGRGRRVKLSKYGYREGTASYPTLLDFNGRIKAPHSNDRANRTFIGVDRKDRVIMGNTRGDSFTLYELGEFLSELRTEQGLSYMLNLDGGRPSCMAVNADEFEYVNHTGISSLFMPKIPVVISVSERV